MQALTIPKVKAQFDPIANTIEQTAPLLAGATITIDALYGLDASDLKAAVEDTVFFCGVAGSPVHVDVTIPQLPQGQYALTLVHATGVKQPQQMAFLLQKNGRLAARRLVCETAPGGWTRQRLVLDQGARL